MVVVIASQWVLKLNKRLLIQLIQEMSKKSKSFLSRLKTSEKCTD
jgi:hypothetical protein